VEAKVWVQVVATRIKSQIYRISKEKQSVSHRFPVTTFRHPGQTPGAMEDGTAFKVALVINTVTDVETRGQLLANLRRIPNCRLLATILVQ